MFVTTDILIKTCTAICVNIPVAIKPPNKSGALIAIINNLHITSKYNNIMHIAPNKPNSSHITEKSCHCGTRG